MSKNGVLKIIGTRMFFLIIMLLFLFILPAARINHGNDGKNHRNTGTNPENASIDPVYKSREIAAQSDTARKTIPYTLPWDDMPIDLSFVYAEEKPAGKHGFLQVRGDRFVFEDGTQARFWGTNFNSAQNFPSHEQSEKVARRLAKTGVNMVRFHQMDAEWATPNIFQFTKGEYKPDTKSFDPVSMDRLDYLIHCLKQEGVYVYMDLLTYRKFKKGDGIKADVPEAGKPYSTFDPGLIELQKKFNYDLWTHENPYTGLAYKDDPAIALTDITNENSLFTQGVTKEPYRAELEEQYREWARRNGISVGKGKVEFDRFDPLIQQFFLEVTKGYYAEMIRHMRETGVRIPITGTTYSGSVHLAAQMVTDFIDSHAYFGKYNAWHLKEFRNESMTGSTANHLRVCSNRVTGKPFFVSEWDNPYPNEWRAESSLLLAAAGSLQGWGGYCIHTYRYGLAEDVDMIGHGYRGIIDKRVTPDAIAGRSYRGGLFDTYNDPAKFGLFYHAALIMRRGDVRSAENTLLVKIDELSLNRNNTVLTLAPEKHRVEIVIPGTEGKGDIEVIGSDEPVVDVDKGEVLSDTGEIYRNLKKKYGWIDSPSTKAVYGFVGEQGKIGLTGMDITVQNDFATLAISSLTDETIKNSRNMLLTAVGRADNTDSRYNADHTESLEIGHGPIQVEIIEATVELETDRENLRVMAINPQGFVTGYIPATYRDGRLSFTIGNDWQSMYYLIQDL